MNEQPERSLGSNQVLFGGMSCPASVTAMSCSMRVGKRWSASDQPSSLHAPLELGGAADAADEVDVLRRARVGDAEDRREELVLADRAVERRDRVGASKRARAHARVPPAAADEDAEGERARSGAAPAPARRP